MSRCRMVPCAAQATHIVRGHFVTRTWTAEASDTTPRYCQQHAEVKAARNTIKAQRPAAHVEGDGEA